MEQREVLENYFYRNLSIERLKEEYPTKSECIDEIYAIILDTVCSKRKTIRIAGDDKPKEVVHGQFMKLEANHIRYVLSVLGQASNIRNTKQYLLAALYNASLTMTNYYCLQQNNIIVERS